MRILADLFPMVHQKLSDANVYRAPIWLPGGHLQTIYASAFVPRPRPCYRRERWNTPDNDFIDLDWVDNDPDRPLVVLFHGLEGSSYGHYAVNLMVQLRENRWSGVVVHFRGCSGETNLLPRAYHSGDAAEIDWILRRIRGTFPNRKIYAVGVSLGGNALLKWLGQQGDKAKNIITAACAVSAPLDLMAAGEALGKGFNMLYTWLFLRTLKRKILAKLVLYPGLFNRKIVFSTRTLRDFDNVVTAPLHGFRDTDDYWTRASSKPDLRHIGIPTLIINARNDPFMPATALPAIDEVSPEVTLYFPEEGGHVGFVSGRFPGNLGWLPLRMLSFLESAK